MINTAARRHPKMTFDFAVSHWDKIASVLEPAFRARFVPSLLNTASDLRLIDELNTFAAAHIPPDGRQQVRKSEASVLISPGYARPGCPRSINGSRANAGSAAGSATLVLALSTNERTVDCVPVCTLHLW
jgi:hypothetical protein